MRKIILSLATSLDGYIEGPNREVDWMVFTEETGKALSSFLTEIDTILYGRTSYEAWGNYTPPETAASFEKDFYTATGKMKKYVFSRTAVNFDGNPAIIQSDIVQAMQQLQQEKGKNIWLYGGAALISTFINLGLIDEYRIAIMPIILGGGNPLFKNIAQRVNLKLAKLSPVESGVIQLNYEKIN